MFPVYASIQELWGKEHHMEFDGERFSYQEPDLVLSFGVVASTACMGCWRETSVPSPVPLIKQQALVAKHFVGQSHRAFSLSCGRQ